MPAWITSDSLFIGSAFFLQVVLIVHFALRKWRFDTAIRFGPIVYALSLLYVIISVYLISTGKSWSFWLGGFLYLVWAVFGFTVEYIYKIEWRNSLRWSILGPFVGLYLATIMFYWWPLALISKPLWVGYAVLFVTSTVLNVVSHKHSKVQTLTA